MNDTVLIAESDAELAELLAMCLSENGFSVETASDGLDCLLKLRRSRPSVLVLDLELRWGGSDGILAWLNEECPTPYPNVILTATAGYPLDAGAVFAPPVIDYLSKPFSPDALLESVALADGLELWT
jgi:DNA-binding response OmpR family regulator